jgi:hypothetical protein
MLGRATLISFRTEAAEHILPLPFAIPFRLPSTQRAASIDSELILRCNMSSGEEAHYLFQAITFRKRWTRETHEPPKFGRTGIESD